MDRFSRILLLSIFILTNFTTPSFATDMSQGLQCPPGWTDNRSARGDDLIKQCISPNQDGAIELYAAPGQEVPLGALLDMWAQEMTQRGLPFQNKVSEVPGQVSGYTAVTRTYSGQTRDGNLFDSHLVASRYNGVNYIFQGFVLKGRSNTWQQLRHAMNTWYYPGAGQQNNAIQQGGLPLGSGHMNNPGNTNYGNDPYGNQQASTTNTPYGNDPYSNQQHASNTNPAGNSGSSFPKLSGTFLSDKPDFIGGKKQYRIYFFYDDGTYSTALKNASTGKVLKGSDRKRFKVKKSGNYYVVNGGGSCTDGYVTHTEHNNITRFKSGCYTSAGKAMYFKRVNGNISGNTSSMSNAGTNYPVIAGTFIADKTDYWGGQEHYRIYHFNGDGTYTQGHKTGINGKIQMGKNKFKYRVSKSGKKFVIKGAKNYCTEGYVKEIDRNKIVRFMSGCYTHKGKKRIYFDLVQ